MIGKFCVFRTYSAGVHMGYLKEIAYTPAGAAARIQEARRLWFWSGAFTLNEVSVHGVGEDSRISEPVDDILLTEVVEVIPCTEVAQANLSRTRNTTPTQE